MKKISLPKVEMLNGHYIKNIILFVIPLILTQLLITLFNSADIAVCNLFGSNISTASISATTTLTHVSTNFITGITIGTNILISRYFGSNEKEKANKVIGSSLILGVIIGVIIMMIGLLCSRSILVVLQTPESILDNSTLYIQITFIGVPFLLTFTFIQAMMRSIGKNLVPMIILTLSGLLNFILNLIFVVVCHLDVAGVAMATTISQVAALIGGIIILFKEKGFLSIHLKEIEPSWQATKDILVIGVPAGFESALFSFANLFVQTRVNEFGTAAIAAKGAAGQIDNYVNSITSSFASAVTAFISASFGAKKLENAKPIRRTSILLMIATTLLAYLILFLIRVPLFNLFVPDQETLELALYTFYFVTGFYFIYGIASCYAATIRAYDHSFISTVGMFCSIVPIRLIWVELISRIPQLNNYKCVMLCYLISYFIAMIVLFLIFHHYDKKLFKDTKTQLGGSR